MRLVLHLNHIISELCNTKSFLICSKALKKNWRVQILCSNWITDFSELYRELSKTDQGLLSRRFLSPPKIIPVNNYGIFEKPANQPLPLLKTDQGQSPWILIGFSRFKSFWHQMPKNLYQIKLKPQVKMF